MNAKMSELKRCFEVAGFSEVKTVLSSGNVVFSARGASVVALEQRAEKVMLAELGRSFGTIVRPVDHLRALIESDPFAEFDLSPKAKRIVTFLRRPVQSPTSLPIERDGAKILKLVDAELFTAYVPSDKGGAFMRVIERAFGADLTTRTLDTVKKCARE
jgi:uncharacterized protein (DUF1697 family)